jgi:hypothetical protein
MASNAILGQAAGVCLKLQGRQPRDGQEGGAQSPCAAGGGGAAKSNPSLTGQDGCVCVETSKAVRQAAGSIGGNSLGGEPQLLTKKWFIHGVV